MCFISWKASFYIYISILMFLIFQRRTNSIARPMNRLSEEINYFFFLNSYFWETIFFFHYFTHLYLSFRYNINRKWNGDLINILIDVRYKKFISIWKVWWIYLNTKISILHCFIKLINPFDHMRRANFDSRRHMRHTMELKILQQETFLFFTNNISKIKIHIHPMLQSLQAEMDT